MKHYFVKLVVGRLYKTRQREFLNGQQTAVSEEEFNYLKTLVDKRLIDQGDKQQIIAVPLFECKEEEATVEEKVANEIKDAPDSLRHRKRKEEAD